MRIWPAFVTTFVAFSAASGHAQPVTAKVVRVGILVETTAAKYQPIEKPFVETLRELGWIEGRNITYDRVFADDDSLKLPALAELLIARQPDPIVNAKTARASKIRITQELLQRADKVIE